MSDDLKPCPFCGARVATYRDEIGGYEVYCDGEVGCAGDGDSRYSTETQAIAAWNRRASDERIERLRGALRECAADYTSPPCTISMAGLYVGEEFNRRMCIAAKALENT